MQSSYVYLVENRRWMLITPPFKMNPILQLDLRVPWPQIYWQKFFSPFQLPHNKRIKNRICHHLEYGYIQGPRLWNVPFYPQPSLLMEPVFCPHPNFTLTLSRPLPFLPTSQFPTSRFHHICWPVHFKQTLSKILISSLFLKPPPLAFCRSHHAFPLTLFQFQVLHKWPK